MKVRVYKPHKLHKKRHVLKNFVLLGAGAFVLFVSFFVIWIFSINIPNFNSINDRKITNSTKIYDKTGEILLYDIHQDVKRTSIPFGEMSANIKNATVAIEDSDFYNHQGIRVTSIIRAVLANLFSTGGPTQGGSTITQQLVKNTLLTPKKTLARKIKEWVLAIKIDKSLPKEKILELYLNESPYGGEIYGIEEASKTYFDKHANDLTLAESAYLASIPQSPTTLSPYGKNLAKLEERKNLVLSRMRALNFITEEEYQKAKNESVVFSPKELSGIKAPHFVFFIKDYLEQKYGVEAVEKGGFKVTTTLDYDLQKKAEEIVKEGALKNKKDWNGENAALVAIDPRTGQILSMVGSRDYFDKEIDGNFNVATAVRQPGSSFKPFIYATAFNKGFTPDTVLFDLPTEFNSSCTPYGKATTGLQKNCYMPDNYDGGFRGPMTLRNGLAQSINVIAVKLFYLAGQTDALNLAKSMGISTLTDISRYGLTLVIGGGEVKLLDMTSAYGIFANDGIRHSATGILKVENIHGEVVEEYKPSEGEQVIPKNTALTLSDILKDNVARTPTFGANSPLVVPGHQVAVKTGTTNSNKDAWTVGYTPSIAVGVWAGNNDNKPMKKGGSAVAGPIWNKFMVEALKTLPTENFEKPDLEVDPKVVKPALRGQWLGGENFFIDKISGGLATEFTPKETLQEKVVTNVHTILHWIDKKDILGPAPSNPEKDSQYNNWEVPVQNWWAKNSYKYGVTTLAEKPTFYDYVHTSASGPTITITSPNNTQIYPADEKIYLQILNGGQFPLQKIDVFINNVFIDSLNSPFNFSFTPADLDTLKYENELKIISYDSSFNRTESTVLFKVQ